MCFKNASPAEPWRLAWLLRADLRNGELPSAPIPHWFRIWWDLEGHRSYPMWPAKLHHELMVPLSDWPSYQHFGMTPVLRYLLDRREDLRQAFDVATDHGLWQAIAWFVTHGMREYGLLTIADPATLAALDGTPPDLGEVVPTLPSLTWLMFLVWCGSAGLQAQFDLRSSQGRADFLHWFCVEGVVNLELAALMAPRWRDWMREPIPLPGQQEIAVPRAAWLMWQRRADLQQAFDVSEPDGAAALVRWSNAAWHIEPGLGWATDVGALTGEAVIPIPEQDTRPFGVNLIGFAFGELGIGEDVRMAAVACEEAGIPFTVINVHPGDQLRQADQALAGHVTRAEQRNEVAPYAINLFCLTGFDTARVLLERGQALFSGRKNIGWWPWELPMWPQDWQIVFGIIDEVWAATRFTEIMYTAAAKKADAPTFLMPLPASVERVTSLSRLTLNLPQDRFLFLYVFDFNSYLARKNPFAALKAFRAAFPASDQTVGLVLKTMNSNPNDPKWKRFVRECGKDDRITLLDITMERGEVLGLIEACDVYLSLHRSEGFGRTLAEAMLFGKPVVATNFSGNVDFLNAETGFPVRWKRRAVQAGEYPFVTQADGPWWADPDSDDAARQMRAARAASADPAFAAKVKCFALEQFSAARIGAMMRTRLEAVFGRDDDRQ